LIFRRFSLPAAIAAAFIFAEYYLLMPLLASLRRWPLKHITLPFIDDAAIFDGHFHWPPMIFIRRISFALRLSLSSPLSRY
jgi:hypothetical protein